MVQPIFVDLKGFPMPPSANHIHKSIPVRPGQRFSARARSKEYKDYIVQCDRWAMENFRALTQARDIANTTGPGICLSLKTIFRFQRSSIIAKDGRPRMNDTSNRLKALHDVLANLIHVDDSYFWRGSFDKQAVSDFEPESVDVTIIQSLF